MDSRKDNSADESKLDTSHIGPVKQSKKSKSKVIAILVVVVVVVAAAVGGGLYYKKTQDDKKAADAAAAAERAAEKKQATPEEQITQVLTDNAKKQIDTLKQDDGKDAIQNSTAAAQQVGRDLNETDLED